MKKKNILLLLSVVLVIVIVFYGLQGNNTDPAYAAKILKAREEKDGFMRTSAESPFAKAEGKFNGLRYFAPDATYRVVANLIPVENRKMVTLSTNDGKTQRYLEYAQATFTLDGVDCKLSILEVMDMGPFRGKLFLAFGDETSARETYGAGRYLDLNKVPGSTSITLDFNEAYNPYCAYDNSYSCPLPPPENLLKVAVKAGEKSYH